MINDKDDTRFTRPDTTIRLCGVCNTHHPTGTTCPPIPNNARDAKELREALPPVSMPSSPLMKIDEDGNVEIIPEPMIVNALCEHKGRMFAATNQGLFIVEGDKLVPVLVGDPVDD